MSDLFEPAEVTVALAPSAATLSIPTIERRAERPKEVGEDFSQRFASSVLGDGNPLCALSGDSGEVEKYGGRGPNLGVART